MASLIEAISIKRKMFFEFENAPYHCIDVEVSKPTARGGQTLVRIKMRNLLTRAVFDKTFKAGEKFKEPDLVMVPATFLYSDGQGFNFMDQENYETLTLGADMVGDDRGAADGQRGRADPQVQRQSDWTSAPLDRGARGQVHRTGHARRHGQRQRDQGGHARAPVSRFACRCSSKKARRSRSTPRPANSPDAPSALDQPSLTARSRRRYKSFANGRS